MVHAAVPASAGPHPQRCGVALPPVELLEEREVEEHARRRPQVEHPARPDEVEDEDAVVDAGVDQLQAAASDPTGEGQGEHEGRFPARPARSYLDQRGSEGSTRARRVRHGP